MNIKPGELNLATVSKICADEDKATVRRRDTARVACQQLLAAS